MKEDKDRWKIELISELRNKKLKSRIIGFIELTYNTILPILFTYYLFETKQIIFLLFILFIIFVRIRRK